MTFPEKLKMLRRVTGKSLAKIGEALGVSKTTVGNWEKGVFTPNLYDAAQIARLFGVPLDYLGFDEIESLPEAIARRLLSGAEISPTPEPATANGGQD